MGNEVCRYNDEKKLESWLTTQLGSNWNNGTNSGSFYWNVNNTTSNRNRNIGSHLVNAKKNKKRDNPITLALAKI